MHPGFAPALVARSNDGFLPILVVASILFAIISLVSQKKRRARQHDQARQLAVTHNLVHDIRMPVAPDERFKLLPRGSRTNVLRAGDRPETLYGFLLEYRSGKTTIARIVAVGNIGDSVAHLSFRRSNLLSSLDPNDIEIGDVAFDDRWSIKCDDTGFVQWLLASTNLRHWLGQFDDNVSAPEFEAHGRHVVVSVPGHDLARIPEMLGWARTFSELIQPRPLPPPTPMSETPRF